MDAKESQIYIALILAAIVFAFVIFYFFYSMLRQHKKVQELQRVNSKAQIEMLEKDRERIANDLHDELAPMLALAGGNLKAMEADKRLDMERLLRINTIINEIVQRIRGISFDLMPHTLLAKGLESAVIAFKNSICTENGLHIHFVSPKANSALDHRTAIHVYRIVQEIIHNTVKHAQASNLTIVLTNEGNYVVLSTSDNGIGFDYQQQLRESRGLGLKSMLNRIYLLQAEFSMASEPGKGTSITIKIPQNHG